MAVSSEELAEWIGTTDDEALAADLAVAVELVTRALRTATGEPPEVLVDRMVLEVGQAVYDRRKSTSSNQSSSLAVEGQAPVMAPRDPLARVWPLLRRLGVRPF